jgi:hypothetical protein
MSSSDGRKIFTPSIYLLPIYQPVARCAGAVRIRAPLRVGRPRSRSRRRGPRRLPRSHPKATRSPSSLPGASSEAQAQQLAAANAMRAAQLQQQGDQPILAQIGRALSPISSAHAVHSHTPHHPLLPPLLRIGRTRSISRFSRADREGVLQTTRGQSFRRDDLAVPLSASLSSRMSETR